MSRIPLSQATYLDVLNTELKNHSRYVPGMQFYSVGTGYDWYRVDNLDGIYAEVSNAVKEKHRLAE